ncbi:MAG: hypothetical protein QM766_25485 [Burkholderiaceae bacterium]
MFGIFVITAREAAELFVVLYFIIECVRRAGGQRPVPLLATGAAIGVGLGAAAAGLFDAEAVPSWGTALLSALVALAIIGLVSGGLETVAKIRRAIDARFDGLSLRAATALAFAMALLAGLREAFECWAQVRMLSEATPSVQATVPVIAAIALTSCVAAAGPRLRRMVGATLLFRASALAVMLVAVDMLVDALGVLAVAALDAGHFAAGAGVDPTVGGAGFGNVARAALMAGLLVLAAQRWWREAR